MFLIDLRMKFRGFAVQFFTVSHIFSNFSSIVIGFVFYKLFSGVLLLESFESNLFELNFLISKKRVSTVKHSQEGELFLYGYAVFFHSFSYIKTLLKVSDPVLEKSQHESKTLKEIYQKFRISLNNRKIKKFSVFLRVILSLGLKNRVRVKSVKILKFFFQYNVMKSGSISG